MVKLLDSFSRGGEQGGRGYDGGMATMSSGFVRIDKRERVRGGNGARVCPGGQGHRPYPLLDRGMSDACGIGASGARTRRRAMSLPSLCTEEGDGR